mmetsp:Transcript_774/g.1338  ORF Transcript_774/g.1338 Transcript_774/m.1338 type:complete len:206 (+) Transcript_774:220-837(+)
MVTIAPRISLQVLLMLDFGRPKGSCISNCSSNSLLLVVGAHFSSTDKLLKLIFYLLSYCFLSFIVAEHCRCILRTTIVALAVHCCRIMPHVEVLAQIFESFFISFKLKVIHFNMPSLACAHFAVRRIRLRTLWPHVAYFPTGYLSTPLEDFTTKVNLEELLCSPEAPSSKACAFCNSSSRGCLKQGQCDKKSSRKGHWSNHTEWM